MKLRNLYAALIIVGTLAGYAAAEGPSAQVPPATGTMQTTSIEQGPVSVFTPADAGICTCAPYCRTPMPCLCEPIARPCNCCMPACFGAGSYCDGFLGLGILK